MSDIYDCIEMGHAWSFCTHSKANLMRARYKNTFTERENIVNRLYMYSHYCHTQPLMAILNQHSPQIPIIQIRKLGRHIFQSEMVFFVLMSVLMI